MGDDFTTANGTVRPEVPWIRMIDMPDREPLSRADVETLRADGMHEVAEIAERILDRRERRLTARLRRPLAARSPSRTERGQS